MIDMVEPPNLLIEDKGRNIQDKTKPSIHHTVAHVVQPGSDYTFVCYMINDDETETLNLKLSSKEFLATNFVTEYKVDAIVQSLPYTFALTKETMAKLEIKISTHIDNVQGDLGVIELRLEDIDTETRDHGKVILGIVPATYTDFKKEFEHQINDEGLYPASSEFNAETSVTEMLRTEGERVLNLCSPDLNGSKWQQIERARMLVLNKVAVRLVRKNAVYALDAGTTYLPLIRELEEDCTWLEKELIHRYV